tara:strand:- start:10825 stop:11163 length:339 start_codon:yes stop_codon:yes gene_type:complete
MSRYKNTTIKVNNWELYKKLRKERGIPGGITQYNLTKLPKLTVEDVSTVNSVGHVWSTGDRLYKLASQHYGDPKLWWIIAWYNNKPTEGHLAIGEIIQIPLPLEHIYSFLRM